MAFFLVRAISTLHLWQWAIEALRFYNATVSLCECRRRSILVRQVLCAQKSKQLRRQKNGVAHRCTNNIAVNWSHVSSLAQTTSGNLPPNGAACISSDQMFFKTQPEQCMGTFRSQTSHKTRAFSHRNVARYGDSPSPVEKASSDNLYGCAFLPWDNLFEHSDRIQERPLFSMRLVLMIH